MVQKSKGSLGVLSGLSLEDTQETSLEVKKEGTKELKVKRSYSLPESTIRKLQELKNQYPLGTSLEDIVNEAILELFKKKSSKEV
jgi:hypothetical protein